MSNLDLEKIIFPNDNNTYIIRDAQAHTDLANKADKDGSNIIGPWTMNITGHASQDIASTEKRQPGGVAELDQNAKIITSQLPSSVDEIIEGYYFNNKFYEDAQYTKEITGEASKIYIDLSSNQTYRWSGSTYVEISPSIALGVEHSTAGYGDWTNTAYLHATDANKISAAVASGLYKIAATSEGHIASLTAITKADITALGIPAQDTTYSQGTGISIDNNNVINHSNSVTAGTAKGDDSKTLTFGGTFTIPSVTYDAQGHITTKGTTTMTMPGNPNTDRYVNSASFAHDSTNDNVKMTLTRAGSDTVTVTANIPKVSSSSAGVAPKGASVSSQSQNTKFLREDGTWAKPSYTTNTNTTYTLGTSGNTVTLTPSSGSVQSITVPFATNSTKATQDASGNTITTTYRRLDNNTFDTISVTDLTAGDVVVTGVGRFTNGLYGNLTGNADTATNVGWNGVTGKPSTYPPSPHSHAEIYTVGDYRSSATTPNDYKNMLRFQGLKSKATIDSPSSDTYSYLLGLRGWADNSGGDAWELAFNNSGINVRHGATTTWGSWTKLLDSSNYNDYAPTKTGTGASGTWGISVSGNAATATKATQDGSGNTITSTYVKLSGDTLNNGAQIVAKTNDTSSSQHYNGGIQLREYNGGGSTLEETLYNAPGISFHWSSRYAGKLSLYKGGHLYFQDKPMGTFTQTEPTSGQIVITDGVNGGIKSSGYTIATSVPSGAVFTDHYDWADITNKPVTFITNSGVLATNGWKTLGGRSSGNKIAISYASSSPATWNSESYSASIVFGCSDTKGLVDCGYNNPIVTFGGGSVNGSTDNAPTWYFKITGTSTTTYNLNNLAKVTQTAVNTGSYTNWRPLVIGSSNNATEGFTPSTVTDTTITASTISCQPSTGTIRATTFKGNATSATTASKLGSSNVGSATQPIYLNAGTATACTYSLGKSVPSDALFTDHTYNFSGTTFYSGNKDTAEHNANNITSNGVFYYSSNGPATSLGAQSTDGALYAQSHSAPWVGQIAQDYRDGSIFVRGRNNSTWYPWLAVLDTGNIGYIMPSTVTYNPHERKFTTSKSTSAWDTQIYSKNGYADNVFICYKPSQTNMAMMIGLNSDPTTDANYTSIDYCWYTQNSGGLSIYENGTSISSATGHTTYAAGDELRIEYSNGYVRYYHNGVLCRSIARAINGKLYMDSSLHGATSTFYDVTFGSTGGAGNAVFTQQTPTSGQVVVTDGTAGVIKSSGYTIAKSVPSNAVFTDHYAWSDITGKPSTFAPTIGTTNTTAMAGNTNVNNVTQTAVTSGTYKLLVSGQNDTTTRSEGVNKCSNITVTATGQIDITSSNGSAIWGTNNLKLSSTASNTLVQVQHLNSNKAIDKYCNVSYSDIDLSSTWDGTNTSLKTAIGAKANAASPTITGNMTMSNGSISMAHNASIIGLSAIELYCPTTSGGHGGFIDFHWNQNTADYTARLIETGSKGTIKAYNSISNASDRRLKDNIVDIDDKYIGLLNIVNAKQYNFKSSEDKTDLGFIAQEVEDGMKQIGIADDKMPIISKPTDNDVDKYYGLDYSQMTALLWKICQVQQKEIDELKNK